MFNKQFKNLVIILAGITCFAAASEGQVISKSQRPNVLQTSSGTIEILGLKRWTVSMLQDSLKKYAGYDLTQSNVHACAAVLTEKLGFPDAAVFAFGPDLQHLYWLITLVEPQDSARLKFNGPYLSDTVSGRPDWADIRALYKKDEIMFQMLAIPTNVKDPLHSDSSFGQGLPPETMAELRKWWDFFDARRTPEDRKIALDVLNNSPNPYDRIIAAGLLTNFAGKDNEVWEALSQALLHRRTIISMRAIAVINSLMQYGNKYPSDWIVMAPAFHAVLDGTNQFLVRDLMTVLLKRFKADTTMAVPLLKNGGSLLLTWAGSDNPEVREMPMQLLRNLSGKDFGTDMQKWRNWIAALN